jgi:hypothetical protein
MTPRTPAAQGAASRRHGDFEDLVAVLDPDILLREDLGRGSSWRFVALRTSPAERARHQDSISRLGRRVQRRAGWVAFLEGEVFAIAALTVRNGRITTLDILGDPARVGLVDLGGL